MTRSLALTNVILQCLLIAMARRRLLAGQRRRLNRHCLVMRVAVGVQIVLIGVADGPVP